MGLAQRNRSNSKQINGILSTGGKLQNGLDLINNGKISDKICFTSSDRPTFKLK